MRVCAIERGLMRVKLVVKKSVNTDDTLTKYNSQNFMIHKVFLINNKNKSKRDIFCRKQCLSTVTGKFSSVNTDKIYSCTVRIVLLPVLSDFSEYLHVLFILTAFRLDK